MRCLLLRLALAVSWGWGWGWGLKVGRQSKEGAKAVGINKALPTAVPRQEEQRNRGARVQVNSRWGGEEISFPTASFWSETTFECLMLAKEGNWVVSCCSAYVGNVSKFLLSQGSSLMKPWNTPLLPAA
jgi:hypothetical protein